jgi:predicted nucleotidyltransferase
MKQRQIKRASSAICERLHSYVNARCRALSCVLPTYLFGSHGRGDADEASDIDLGFLFERDSYIADLKTKDAVERNPRLIIWIVFIMHPNESCHSLPWHATSQ